MQICSKVKCYCKFHHHCTGESFIWNDNDDKAGKASYGEYGDDDANDDDGNDGDNDDGDGDGGGDNDGEVQKASHA